MMNASEEQLNPFERNEIDANRHMSVVLLLAAALALLVWFAYIPNVFNVGDATYDIVICALPILSLLLCTPMLFYRSTALSNPIFKYYVLFLFVLTMSVLNIIMPKHGVLGWVVCIALTGHYYNPRVCRITFVSVAVLMLICLNLGMFYGEYDSDLLSGELNTKEQTISNILLPGIYSDTPEGRLQYLNDLADAGDNRYLMSLAYYGGRLVFITLAYVIFVFLNKRTKALVFNEIVANNEIRINKAELDVARDLQMETLPDGRPVYSDIDVVAELDAANEVGGDLYDYVDIDKDHFAFLIGDVSGKGVPAAMFMMKTITAFRDFAKAGETPAQILNEINSSVLKGNTATMFVTCFLGILDRNDGRVVYANAGHNPPLIGSEGDYRYLRCNPGSLLGCFEKTFVKDEEFVLRPGESITLYTDGITEARNSDGDFFGEERFLASMNRQNNVDVSGLHSAVRDDIAAFVSGAPQSDDMTFMTIRYNGPKDGGDDSGHDAGIVPEMSVARNIPEAGRA